MRMRNIPDAAEKVARHNCFIPEPTLMKGKWRESLSMNGPLHVEIGSGKGRFITALASMHPQTAYVAIERYTTVLTKLVRQIPEQGLVNLAVVNMDARALPDCFSAGEINRIYLNFSDPWPKSRHENRRLTFKGFLDRYRLVLAEEGLRDVEVRNRLHLRGQPHVFRVRRLGQVPQPRYFPGHSGQ